MQLALVVVTAIIPLTFQRGVDAILESAIACSLVVRVTTEAVATKATTVIMVVTTVASAMIMMMLTVVIVSTVSPSSISLVIWTTTETIRVATHNLSVL